MKEDRKTFWISLGVTLAVLILVLGVIAVDYQGRRISLGDSTPPFFVFPKEDGGTGLEVKLLGMDKQFDVSKLKNFWELAWDFFCLPRTPDIA